MNHWTVAMFDISFISYLNILNGNFIPLRPNIQTMSEQLPVMLLISKIRSIYSLIPNVMEP